MVAGIAQASEDLARYLEQCRDHVAYLGESDDGAARLLDAIQRTLDTHRPGAVAEIALLAYDLDWDLSTARGGAG